MRLKPSLLVFVCVLLTFGLTAWTRATRTHAMQTAAGMDVAAIDQFITAQMTSQRVPGLALAITQGDRVLYVKGYGTAGRGQPVTPQTQFLIASLSKSFTAVAVMQLAEAGRIELDAPAQRYLPEFTLADPDAAARITIRHLLNQTSGLSDRGYPELQLPQPTTTTECIAGLRNARPVAPAGSAYAYFNPNYQILARVVETVSGEPFQDYLQAHVFAPLQMNNTTSIVHSAEIAQRAVQLAQGHLLVYGALVPSAEELGYLAGSGGVISTAEDMAHFLVMQSNGGRFNGSALVAPESIAAMHTPPATPASPYGMGWLRLTEGGRQVLEHDGILSTFTADMALVPDAGYGLALLYGVHSLETDLLALPAIRRGVIALLMNEQPAASGFNGTVLELGFIALTLLGAGFALRSLIRLPRWATKARTKPAWRLLPGIAWTFAPAVLVLALPALVLQSSGRAFGLITLYRSMVSLMTWLSICAVLGLINGTARIVWLARRSFNKRKSL